MSFGLIFKYASCFIIIFTGLLPCMISESKRLRPCTDVLEYSETAVYGDRFGKIFGTPCVMHLCCFKFYLFETRKPFYTIYLQTMLFPRVQICQTMTFLSRLMAVKEKDKLFWVC